MAGGGYIVSDHIHDILGITTSVAYSAIVIGIIVCLISFLGCFGALNEKGVILKVYFFLLAVLVLLEIGIGISGYVYRDSVDLYLESTWIKLYESNPSGLIEIENNVLDY